LMKLASEEVHVDIDIQEIPEWVYKYAKIEQADGHVIIRTSNLHIDKILSWLDSIGVKYSRTKVVV